MLQFLTDPFRQDNRRISWPLVGLFLLIHVVVSINLKHDISAGYDIGPHMDYAKIVAQGRLPVSLEDTFEFFSAPLVYLLPAALYRSGMSIFAAFEVARGLQLGFSLIICFITLRLCCRISHSVWLRIVALGLLGMMPVYYRSMALWRPEAMLAMLGMIAIDYSLHIESSPTADRRRTLRQFIILGVLTGLILLTRQWGFLLIPALAMLPLTRLIRALRGDENARRLATAMAISVAVAILVSSWFYFHLWAKAGSPMAFNRETVAGHPLLRQPREFYLDILPPALFKRPIMHEMPHRFVPQFYSDFFGDYYLMYLIYGKDRNGRFLPGRHAFIRAERGQRGMTSNVEQMVPFLVRVNKVSILPALVLLVGAGYGVVALIRALCIGWRRRLGERVATLGLMGGVIVGSFVGYLLFVIVYADFTGETIKATYMLQTYPMIAILSALMLEKLRAWNRWLHGALLAGLLAVALHNSPAFFSRYLEDSPPGDPLPVPRRAR